MNSYSNLQTRNINISIARIMAFGNCDENSKEFKNIGGKTYLINSYNPFTNLEQAMLVVMHLAREGHSVGIDNFTDSNIWEVEIIPPENSDTTNIGHVVFEKSENLCEAICLATLRIKGIDINTTKE